MLNVGPLELLAIAALALVVLGPDRLPGALRQVGRAIGELRRISGGFQDELRRAVDDSLDDSDAPTLPPLPDKPAETPPVIPPEEAAGLDFPSERADTNGDGDGDTAVEEPSAEPVDDESPPVTDEDVAASAEPVTGTETETPTDETEKPA